MRCRSLDSLRPLGMTGLAAVARDDTRSLRSLGMTMPALRQVDDSLGLG